MMLQKLQKFILFKTFINTLAKFSYKGYHIVMVILVIVGTVCNYSSSNSLPMFWILVGGFVTIVYLDIYSIKQTYMFDKKLCQMLPKEYVFDNARQIFEKRMYSNKNWLISLILPLCIVPVVVYIIKCPLGLSIRIFAYTALYFILVLCFIGYTQYVNLILMAYYYLKHAKNIKKYNRIRPHKTKWIVELASLINMQSNLFFFVGSGFIALLYLITFTGFYAVSLDITPSKIIVIYLWGIIAVAIVFMFPIFSLCSYFVIKKLISQLVEKQIKEYANMPSMLKNKNNEKNYYKILHEINQLKILMLEKSPVYPQKPLIAYAFSYIIAIINFFATIDATLSLIQYIQ